MSDQLFLSHASPEDNEFTLWLALQLAKEGYAVWCDLTRLLGGEEFWRDIEQTIRQDSTKFLYVLSKTSNSKQGPLQELQVAHTVMRQQQLSDFIIPLLMDNLSIQDVNIQLSMLNVIDFSQGWAAGLNILLSKLEQDSVPRSPRFTPQAVASWWRGQFSASQGITSEPEEYLSNWFPIEALPQKVYFHVLRRTQIGKVEVSDNLPYPAFQHNQYLVSFAQADDFVGKLGAYMTISDTHVFQTEDFLDGLVERRLVDRKQVRNFVSRLLRMGWDSLVRARQLPIYKFANGASCSYFTKGLTANDKASFVRVDGKTTYRNVVGYKTLRKVGDQETIKRYWHFGVQAKPLIYPAFAYVVKPHVLFSYDGNQIWESKDRLHKARRSQCRNWWNPEWRDRILATMTWLANEDGKIEVQLASDAAILVSISPLTFVSPVSYTEPKTTAALEDVVDYDGEDDLDLDEEEEKFDIGDEE